MVKQKTRFLFRPLLICLFLVGLLQSRAQDFGNFRPGIRWQQINTPTLRVIFPAGLEDEANRVTNNILYLDQNNRTSIGGLSKKLNLILNNQGIISNGYVTIMPFRSEFYTTPMQNSFLLGSMEWLDVLSVHEYRHALQFMNLLRGTNKFAYYLLGEAGWGLMMNPTIPGWFFEGDAVANETALTNQGRGRLPSFTQLSRSLLLNDRTYSYMKARNGSYRHRVPDEYELGYMLCSYGRQNWGNDLWLKVLKRTTTLKGIIYPFSDALQVHTGLTTKRLYKTTLEDYRNRWHQQEMSFGLTSSRQINWPSSVVTDYQYPVFLSDSTLFVLKKSYREIPAIYRIDLEGNEEKICMTGITTDNYFSSSGPWIAWTEVTWDARYQATNYSDVVLYNTMTRQRSRLTAKQRYFSPAISPDQSRIVVAESDQFNNYHLKILDLQSGQVIAPLPNPDNLYFTYPKWDADGRSIISSARTNKGNMLIIKQEIESGVITPLTREFNHTLGEVYPYKDKILFTASFSGINNVFALDRDNGKMLQLTSSRFGAFNPALSPDGSHLLYSDFNFDGYHLSVSGEADLLWKEIEPVPLDQNENFEFSYFAEEGGNIFDRVPQSTFTSTPYKPVLNGMRLHSWGLSPSSSLSSIGFHLVADNIISDLHAEGGLDYFINEGAPGISAGIRYGRFYPIFGAEYTRYYRSQIDLVLLERSDTTELNDIVTISADIPLNLSRGAFWQSAGISFGYDFISSRELTGTGYTPTDNHYSFHSLSAVINFRIYKKQAYQNITTPLGFGFDLSRKQSVTSLVALKSQVIVDFAVRGLFLNHNLILSTGWLMQKAGNDYRYVDDFIYPRGYFIPANDQMITIQSSYHFPLLYPDFGFGGILYFSRIRASLLADYGRYLPSGAVPDAWKPMASAGGELIFDIKWFNLAEVPLGIRLTRLFYSDQSKPDKKLSFEFFLPILRL